MKYKNTAQCDTPIRQPPFAMMILTNKNEHPQHQWLFWVSKWSNFWYLCWIAYQNGNFWTSPFGDISLYTQSILTFGVLSILPVLHWNHWNCWFIFCRDHHYNEGVTYAYNYVKMRFLAETRIQFASLVLVFFLNWKLELVTKCIDTHSFLV